MNLSYKLKRLRIKFKKIFYKEKSLFLNEIQEKSYEITKKLILDKNSELFYDVITSRYCIKNLNTLIYITKSNITISNENGYYDVYIDDRTYSDITNKFRNRINKKINQIDRELKLKIKTNLDSLFK
jgi:hypothetical protein